MDKVAKDVYEIGQLRELLVDGLKLTRKRLIADKKKKKLKIAISDEGKVVFVSPNTL